MLWSEARVHFFSLWIIWASSSTLYWKGYIFPHWIILASCWKSINHMCGGLFLSPLFCPLISMSILMPVLYCLDSCPCIMSWSQKVKSSNFVFLSKFILALPGPFYFHANFRINLLISTGKPSGNLTGVVLYLWIG